MNTDRRGFFGLVAGAVAALKCAPSVIAVTPTTVEPIRFHPDAFAMASAPFDAGWGVPFEYEGTLVQQPDGSLLAMMHPVTRDA